LSQLSVTAHVRPVVSAIAPQPAISTQPVPGQPGGQAQWMAAPASIPGVPPGLEYLTQIDQLLIHQQIELLERELVKMSRYD